MGLLKSVPSTNAFETPGDKEDNKQTKGFTISRKKDNLQSVNNVEKFHTHFQDANSYRVS